MTISTGFVQFHETRLHVIHSRVFELYKYHSYSFFVFKSNLFLDDSISPESRQDRLRHASWRWCFPYMSLVTVTLS